MHWGGDDWSLCAATSEETTLLASDDKNKTIETDVSFTKGSKTTTELKIKITKKQLQELLSRAELKELTVEQVVAQLMDVSDRFETNQRSWRPALQSIPEIN